MDNRKQPQSQALPLMDQLRARVPNLHPYSALVLTLEPMLHNNEISSEEYLKWAAALTSSRKRGLFSLN